MRFEGTMDIALDGLVLGGQRDGSFVYSDELVHRLTAHAPENRYTVFVQDGFVPALRPCLAASAAEWRRVHRPRVLPHALYHELYFARTHLSGFDLLHTLAFFPPRAARLPVVLTLHDLNFWTHPETMKWTGRLWWRLFARAGIQRATHIIASSQATRRELVVRFRVPADRITVVYPCVREGFGPVPGAQARLERYRLPDHYLLYVGTIEPRKNLVSLVRAFARARALAHSDHHLVLAGSLGWNAGPAQAEIARQDLRSVVHLIGYVPDADLPALYSGADLFALISWNEGFGLSLLEAMACGTPVLASNCASMPEIVGDAGALVSPDDVAGIAESLAEFMVSPARRAASSERGLARARAFAPERFTAELLQVYHSVKDSSP